MVLRSQGATSFELNGSIITTPTTSLINAGSQIIFRTLGTTANIEATTSGTNLNFETTGAGQLKRNTGFFGSIGNDIVGAITLPLSLKDIYMITGAGAFTVTLPTNSASYAGASIIFRRLVGVGIITFNQTGGASVMIASSSLATVASVTLPGANVSTQFISNGTFWTQLYTI